jgi:hypothetical protein
MTVDLYALKREHGGTVYDGGRRWVGPGPGHSRHDASLSVRLADDGRPLVHSFAGDPFDVCAAHLGIEAERRREPEGRTSNRAAERAREEAARRENAARRFCEALWQGAQPVEGGPGERYFEARALDWFPADVRFHPAAPRGYDSRTTGPAILALSRSIIGAPKAVQATFLTPDLRVRRSRTTFGALLGAAVRLAPAGASLAVAEGLETAVSFARLEAVATWACLGTANLRAFQPPAVVRHLTIAADGDAAGMDAALALAARLRPRCDVSIRPAPEGSDWNDVATGMAYV